MNEQARCEGCGQQGTFENPVTVEDDGAWHDQCYEESEH